MLQLVTALLTVGLPALVLYGSSRRRQLSFIRDQAKTLDAVKGIPAAAEQLRQRIVKDAVIYCAMRESDFRGLAFITFPIGMFVCYAGVIVWWMLRPSDGDPSNLAIVLGLSEAGTDLARVLALYGGMVGFVASILVGRIVQMRARMKRMHVEWGEEV